MDRNEKREKVDKESEDEIRHRYLINSDATFKSLHSKNIDATNSIKSVFLKVQSLIWDKARNS